MNPGLVVKLRPAGPWRIGPDSGARNRVDVIYHSDSLYSAVTGAMSRLGWLEDWLAATAREAAPAVCFSSCFPFLDDIGFVVPPRTIWPPSSPALLSARVRWKSARFVPLGIVQALLAGQTLDGSHWSVDGPSECLVPTGRIGPFRTGVRFNAAVDRFTGATERHSTACIEFRSGAGLWAIASFRDDAARDRWQDPVKAAFRWLADTGFGGERSRGWGRSESPEFVEGTLPEMILPPVASPASAVQEAPADAAPLVVPPEPGAEMGFVPEAVTASALSPDSAEPAAAPLGDAAPADAAPVDAAPIDPVAAAPEPVETAPVEAAAANEPPAEAPAANAAPEPRAAAAPIASHWLLSLFSPSPSDAVDWRQGNYTILSRGGRIESPVASGDLKKQVNMVAEGSVVSCAAPPLGAAPNVAPDGFAHPVFRAGYAVAIPLPHSEVS